MAMTRGYLWSVFLVSLILGCGLLLGESSSAQLWGVVLLVAPILIFGVILAVSYARSRAGPVEIDES